tara:strand:+ start:812 stop:2176 length:1365 start_codon:yes stop_codon:yes gene_type:complete
MMQIVHRRLKLTAIVIFTLVALPATGQVINEDFKFIPSDAAGGERFGFSIAIDNGVVAVGANRDDDNGTKSGSAYIFDASTGAQLFKLLPSDGAANDAFGYSIAIDNGVVAVGAVGDGDNGSSSGSAYLFDALTGVQIAKLLPSDGEFNDRFGYSIAIHNGIVAVGATQSDDNGSDSGSVYLFDALTGVQITKLLPNDQETQWFGSSIAIDTGIVAVGAMFDNEGGSYSGSAYLFDASTGVQIAKLLPSDGEIDDRFGGSIAISNGVVAVGALNDDDGGSDSGSAYLFDASSGVQIAKLIPSDGDVYDQFGISIAIDNGIVAVGAYLDEDNGRSSGSAYLFDASTGGQITKLLPSDGTSHDHFGLSVAIDNGVVVVGAQRGAENGIGSGTGYLFSTPSLCSADLSGDGILDFIDFIVFLDAFLSQNPQADFNNDGQYNYFDIIAFLTSFAEGCQ